MKRFRTAAVALALGWTAQANGATLTCGAGEVCFDLNYYLTGNTATLFNPAYSYGTVKISDLADTPAGTGIVQVNVDLVDTFPNGDVATLKVLQLYLNFVGDPGADANWAVANASPSFTGVTVGGTQNDPPGYNFNFEFQFPDNGNIGFEPVQFDLRWTALPNGDSLVPADFLAAVNDLIYAGVHIGSCGPTDSYTCPGGNSNSISVGAGMPGGDDDDDDNTGGDDDDDNTVPEPGSLALFGAGLLAAGLGGLRRRRR